MRSTDHDVAEWECPKRPWVLAMFADDEALEDGASPPHGLAFHLSRCPSCRSTAEQLRGVSAALRVASEHEPPNHLLVMASARARAALRAGAKLTGRVVVADEIKRLPIVSLPTRHRVNVRYVSAAVILFGLIATLFAVRPGSRHGVANRESSYRSIVENQAHQEFARPQDMRAIGATADDRNADAKTGRAPHPCATPVKNVFLGPVPTGMDFVLDLQGRCVSQGMILCDPAMVDPSHSCPAVDKPSTAVLTNPPSD